MLSTDLPKPISEAIIKCQRTFFWANGRDDATGSCAVAWSNVCRPTEYGGLGVLDVKRMSWALRARWLWLSRVDTSKPWSNFPIKSNKSITSLVEAATSVNIGNGNRALFWTDRWIARQNIATIAPEVFAAVNPRALKVRKVASALTENAWIQDISAALSADGIIQFLHLVDLLQAQQVNADSEDTFVWHLSSSGEYSSKSA
jgi:hypothetical protein